MEASPKVLSDTQLIHGCSAGDQQDFRILVERYQTIAFRFAFRLTGDSVEAQDMCQKAFLRVWNFRARIKPEAPFATLLYTIISRLWIDHLRHHRYRPSGSNVEALDEQYRDPSAGIETVIVNQDLADRIKRMSEALPPRQRLIFTLRDLEDRSIQEVAEITGLSVGSIKTNLSIARLKLRQKLQQITGVSP